MVHVALVAVFVLLNTAAGAPPKHDTEDRLPVSLVADDTQTANASLVENFLDPPVPALEDPGFFGPHSVGNNPNQWRMPDIFKRQAACYNYCGPTQSAPTLYCGCGQGCCSTRCCTTSKGEACCGVNPIFCCNTAAGSLCCATQCCINGATCNGNRVCAFRTVVVSAVATSYNTIYRDISSTVTANGGTVTVTTTISIVAVITISSADVATVVATATFTRGVARRARDLDVARPADIVEQPVETSTSSVRSLDPHPKPGQDVLAPQITQFSTPHDHLAKRQTNFVSTITSVISTATVPTTITRIITTTVSARVTTTYSTIVWQTITSVINAKSTTTSTSTITFIPSSSDGGAGGGAGGGGNNDGANNPPDQVPSGGSKGLSKGAQAGVGAGTAGGSLLICIILAFWFRRRRKSRKEQNQEMIDNAVTSAMAAQRTQSQPQQPIQYDDGKHLSTTTQSVASPHPYSPSPPIHSPQPNYVYPPPPGHQQQAMYNQSPIEFPESGMGPYGPYSSSAPTYRGSEIDGNPVQRYELQQFSSPAPVHSELYNNVPQPRQYSEVPHPGPYTEPGNPRMYSNLPEVRR